MVVDAKPTQLPADLRSGDRVRIDGRYLAPQGQGTGRGPPGQGGNEGSADLPENLEINDNCLGSSQCLKAAAVSRSGGRAAALRGGVKHGKSGATLVPATGGVQAGRRHAGHACLPACPVRNT